MYYLCTRKRETNNAEVAQLVEHNLAKVRVAGSSPVFRSLPKGLVILRNSGAFYFMHQLVIDNRKRVKPKIRLFGVYNTVFEKLDLWKDKIPIKHNFFTSRFYNALDIELDIKPTVIMITEVYFSEYSMIDPNTDTIQAIGRFRNGIEQVCDIFNTNTNFPVRTMEEIDGYIASCEDVYKKLKTLYDCAVTEGARDSFRAALEIVPYNKMLDKEEKITLR